MNLNIASAVFASALLLSSQAHAQEAEGSFQASGSASVSGGSSATGIGLGVEATLTDLTGAALVYQASSFRIDGVLALASQGNTDFALAGRFWYPIHIGQNSDFSIGGGLGVDDDGGGDDDIDIHLEAGAQIRAFITPNVALSTSLGFGIRINEGDDYFGFGGQLLGVMGATYFFD